MPVLWYQIDSGDADPASFFYHLRVAAVQTGLASQVHLPHLTPEYMADLAGFTRRYLRALYGGLYRPCALVLDNCQEIPGDAPIISVLRDMLAERPQGVHVIAISRQEPPAALVRLSVSQQLIQLGWKALRLTEDEAERIASLTRKGEEQECRLLAKRCDGWVAGLTLLLERTDEGAPIQETPKSQQALFDYFTAELFDHLPPETKRLLRRSALLPWVRVEWAQALTGDPKAGSILEDLRRRHLFTDLRGTEEPIYHFHALFRDFLLANLNDLSADERRRLTQDSARLMAEAGEADSAIALFLDADDVQAALHVLQSHAPSMAAQGRLQTLERWISLFPVGMREGDPWLLYWRGVCQMASAASEALSALERAFVAFDRQSDTLGQILSASAIVDTICNQFQYFLPLDRWIAELTRLLDAEPTFPSAVMELEVLSSLTIAVFNRSPNGERLAAWSERILTLLPLVDDVNAKVRAAANIGQYFEFASKWKKMEALDTFIDPLMADPALRPVILYQWCIVTARNVRRLHYRIFERHDDMLKLALEHGLSTFLPVIQLGFATAHLNIGDAQGARVYMEKASASGDRRALETGWYDAIKTGIAAIEGKGDVALEHAQRSSALGNASGGWELIAGSLHYLSVALCVIGQYEQACETALRVHNLTSVLSEECAFANVFTTIAYARLKQERDEEVETLLRRGLAIWADEGRSCTYLWLPKMMSSLLAFALERDIEVDYVRKLIRLRGVAAPSPEARNWPWPVQIHTLGKFEILRDGMPLPKSRKSPKKLIEIIKILLAMGGRDVPEQHLADALWPDKEGDSASDALATGIHRLRKLLGCSDAIRVEDGRISLSQQHVWVDSWVFQSLSMDAGKASEALELYAGSFLPDDSGAPETNHLRSSLRQRYARLVMAEAHKLEHARAYAEAASLYARAIDVEPLVEALYQGLIRCFGKEQRMEEARAVYHRLRHTLETRLQTRPSQATETLYSGLLAEPA